LPRNIGFDLKHIVALVRVLAHQRFEFKSLMGWLPCNSEAEYPPYKLGVVGSNPTREIGCTNLREVRLNAVKLHLYLTLLWAALTLPTILWWRESILWVSLISIYANIATHWSAYQAAHAESKLKEKMEGKDAPNL
jgi:hypothetical protein